MSARVLVPLLTKRQRIAPLPEAELAWKTRDVLADVFRAAKTRALVTLAVGDAVRSTCSSVGRRTRA